MILNVRKRMILKVLCSKQVTLDELAKIINVSTRTIRRDMSVIENIISQFDYTILKNNDKYYISGDNNVLEQLINKNAAVQFSNEEVVVLFLCDLICGPISLKNFCNKYFLVEVNVKDVLSRYETIIIKNKLEYRLIENELEVRNFIKSSISNLIFNSNVEYICEQLSLENIFIDKVHDVISVLLDCSLFNYVATSLDHIAEINNKFISDRDLIEITIFLLITLKRQELRKKIADCYSCDESVFDAKIANILAFDYANRKYVLFNLQSYTLEDQVYNNHQILAKLDYFFEIVNDVLNFNESNTFMLQSNITSHVMRHTGIFDNKLKLDSGLFAQLIIDYNFIFTVLQEAAVTAKLNFVEVEILEVMIYYILYLENEITKMKWDILVICMGGMGTSLMVKNQIAQLLPLANIVNIPLSAQNRATIVKHDLIIASGGVVGVTDALLVNPLLTSEDIRRIKISLVYKKISNRMLVKSQVSKDKEIYFFKQCKVDSKEKSLQQILQDLALKSFIEDENYLLEKLLRREKRGIAIPKTQIAMFHTNSSSINKAVIYIAKTSQFTTKGIDQTDINCQIILLMLLPENYEPETLAAINHLAYLLISSKSIVQIIENLEIEKLEETMKSGNFTK